MPLINIFSSKESLGKTHLCAGIAKSLTRVGIKTNYYKLQDETNGYDSTKVVELCNYSKNLTCISTFTKDSIIFNDTKSNEVYLVEHDKYPVNYNNNNNNLSFLICDYEHHNTFDEIRELEQRLFPISTIISPDTTLNDKSFYRNHVLINKPTGFNNFDVWYNQNTRSIARLIRIMGL